MILVDTSVWINHLRQSDEQLVHLLNAGQVITHPFIIGELALGNFRHRDAVLDALQDLPVATIATDNEVFQFIETHTLYGLGIGYVDAHLLASTRITLGTSLWTQDKRLMAASIRVGVTQNLPH